MRRLIIWAVAVLAAWGSSLRAASAGDSVIILFNRNVPESKEVAEYYAKVRHVPSSQIFGFDLPSSDRITREVYREKIEQPLLKKLESAHLLVYEKNQALAEGSKAKFNLVASKIRYAVIAYGFPFIILEDSNVVESVAQTIQPALRRNEAAVDSELSCLHLSKNGYVLTGFVPNPLYQATNATMLTPINGPLMVARLDGPSAAIARGLVDKAQQAERDGLWGRAYFDARGLTNGSYLVGDEWMRAAAQACRRKGFETVLDDTPPTFPAAFPLSQVAIYAGWYDANVSGPFTRDTVEFMPGAFAYHLHSFSANALRNPGRTWVGPLLAKGATITMGCVLEPYLEATPDIGCFMPRFFNGFTFGEAAYASCRALSWQIVVLGDPLYNPFGRPGRERFEDLAKRQSPLLEWAHLQIIDINEAAGTTKEAIIDYIDHLALARNSAVLTEKFARVCHAKGDKDRAIKLCRHALELKPSPQQRNRLLLDLSVWLAEEGKDQEAAEVLREFQKTVADYPDPGSVWRSLLRVAEKMGETNLVAECQQALQKLEAK